MDPNSSFSNNFDLDTQKGVMSLLAAVRQSPLGNSEKNELRDLVFLYTNGGGDVSVKIALEQKLRTHQIKPLPPVVKKPEVKREPPRPPLPFGSYRPAPVFTVPTVLKTVPKKTIPETKPELASVETIKVSEAVKPIAPPPFTPKLIEKEEPKSNSMPEPKVAPPPTVQNTNVYLDRIREIKSSVNGKVGNPVNLVDIDNQVGREYMSALLEAMKRLSGGQPGGMEAAMSRLETAYVAVEKAVTNHQQKQELELTPTSVITEPVATELPVITPPPPPPPPPQRPIPVASQPIPRPVIVETPAPAPTPTPAPAPAPAPTPTPTPTDLANSPWSTPADFATPAVAIKNEKTPTESIPQGERPISVATNQVAEETIASSYKATSVLEEKRNLTPQDLPVMSSAASRAQTGDPLFTTEIDVGLGQLLSDWSLFKSSGLFGTGPKGMQHPLYKKIADLQIPLLLTGRFEGSTQEIKQSITDYMNGWRYEQGIIYEKGETFERYLRRVIKQILDLQKKRLSS